MDITEQVCSPDRARALKERGVAQDSFFCWYPVPDGGAGELHYHPGLRHELEEQKDTAIPATHLVAPLFILTKHSLGG